VACVDVPGRLWAMLHGVMANSFEVIDQELAK
jgi:hypothetical protein